MATLSVRSSNQTQGESRIGAAAPYILWTTQVLLALLFVFAGVMKFIMSAEDMTQDMDLPISFLRFIGVCEVLGGFGLILPGLLNFRRGLTPLAASGLVVIMIGAVAVTIPAMGVLPAAWPLSIGILAAFVAYNRRAWFNED